MRKKWIAVLIALVLLLAQAPGLALSVDNACSDKRCTVLECKGLGDPRHAPQIDPKVLGYNFRLCPAGKTDLEIKYVEGDYTINGIRWKPDITGKGTLLLGVWELQLIDLANRVIEANLALDRSAFSVVSNILHYEDMDVETDLFAATYLEGKSIAKGTPYSVVGDLFKVKSSTGAFSLIPKSVLTNKRLFINGKFIR